MLNDLPRKTRLNEEVRRAIQNDQGSLRVLAAKYGVNVKTVQKWRRTSSVTDSSRRYVRRRNQLSEIEQAMIVAFRRFTLLPLDDCLYALQALIPKLTRTTLYRCLKNCNIHHLPSKNIVRSEIYNDNKKAIIGIIRVDYVMVNTTESNFKLYIATDIVSKFIFARIYPINFGGEILHFFKCLVEGLPYEINSVLFERNFLNSDAVTGNLEKLNGAMPGVLFHRGSVWNEDQIELTNSIIKMASKNRDFYKTDIGFFEHADRFSEIYNKSIRLKSLNGLTPNKFVNEILSKS